ncbi:MAG: hypothetical protein AB7S26_28895 [Sandaracinaceae bacterium]
MTGLMRTVAILGQWVGSSTCSPRSFAWDPAQQHGASVARRSQGRHLVLRVAIRDTPTNDGRDDGVSVPHVLRFPYRALSLLTECGFAHEAHQSRQIQCDVVTGFRKDYWISDHQDCVFGAPLHLKAQFG